MGEVRYMISDAADKLGMEAHVLRYWEEELELDVPRNEMGHRYYTQEWIGTFDQIRMLKQKGYQLRAIKMLLHSENCFHPEEWMVPVQANTAEMPGKMEQFQQMMTSIVKKALEDNNQKLGETVSDQVGEKVLKEMNYLMREREEQEEERFRKLDEALRQRQKKIKRSGEKVFWKNRRELKKNPPEVMRPREET